MHDIGKISTPYHIINKATKLEGINDKIENIKLKLELLRKDLQKRELKEDSSLNKDDIDEIIKFLVEANRGSEFFSDEDLEYLKKLKDRLKVEIGSELIDVISDDEFEALSVRRGTLSYEERKKIMDHVVETQNILNRLYLPKKFKRVPEIAGAHHEKINGKGYPNGLKGDEISTEARILAIADIFEALTAPDRPYKVPKKLSESMKILYFMAKDGELDYEMVKFFYESKTYLKYAEKFLKPEQIDDVELSF